MGVAAIAAAAIDGDHISRHLRDQRFGRVHVDLQRPQVAVVDADDPRTGVDGN